MRGYYHIPVAAVDVPKTAIITPFGLWEFLRMPFGLKGAAQAFQRMMDRVTQGLKNIFVYLDDILVASDSPEQHYTDLRTLFQRLQHHGLVINRNKCVFGAKEIAFLGHQVSAAGIVPSQEKVRAIRDFPKPSSVKSLQEFLGMLTYYHRFLPHIAGTLAPLYDALAGKKKYATLTWSSQMDDAFITAKDALADATLLIHPVADAPTALTVDASQIAVGAVLEQLVNGIWRPLGFFSRKLREPRETKYPAFDRELLGAFLATRHFRYFLEGRQFTLYTDHNSLVPALRKTAEPHNARQSNQLSNISEFTTDIRAIEGKHNVVADALSRSPVADANASVPDNLPISAIDVPVSVDYNTMAQEQANDADIADLLNNQQTGLRLTRMATDAGALLLCDVSTGVPRPVVPASLRRRVFEAVHGLSHPGIRTTRHLLTAKFVWPRIAADAASWTRACIACQQSKTTRHTRAPLHDFHPVRRRFEHLHIDIVGPLPPSQTFTHLLTVVDRFTRWPEAFPVADTSALSLARAFLNGWVARFGTPTHLTSDRGSQFTSTIWSQLSVLLGAELHHTTAYHPQANGMVERFHRDLKAALRARLSGPNWADELPWVLLGLRTAPREDLHASVAELVYGTTLTVPGDFIAPSDDVTATAEFLRNLREEVTAIRPTPASRHGATRSHVPDNLATADFVFVRHDAHRGPLRRVYDGPFRVLERSDKTFVIDVGGKRDTVTVDRLKRAHEDLARPIVPAQPARRGRPPAPRPHPPSAT